MSWRWTIQCVRSVPNDSIFMTQQLKMTTRMHKGQWNKHNFNNWNMLKCHLSLHFSVLWAHCHFTGWVGHWKTVKGLVSGTNSSTVSYYRQLCKHTDIHTDTHLCTAETHHYVNTGAPSDSGKVQNVHVIGTEGWKDCLGVRPRDWAFCVSRELPWPPW